MVEERSITWKDIVQIVTEVTSKRGEIRVKDYPFDELEKRERIREHFREKGKIPIVDPPHHGLVIFEGESVIDIVVSMLPTEDLEQAERLIIPSLTYIMPEDQRDTPITATYGLEYLKMIMKLGDKVGDELKISIRPNYPLTVHAGPVTFILAPRIRDDTGGN